MFNDFGSKRYGLTSSDSINIWPLFFFHGFTTRKSENPGQTRSNPVIAVIRTVRQSMAVFKDTSFQVPQRKKIGQL